MKLRYSCRNLRPTLSHIASVKVSVKPRCASLRCHPVPNARKPSPPPERGGILSFSATPYATDAPSLPPSSPVSIRTGTHARAISAVDSRGPSRTPGPTSGNLPQTAFGTAQNKPHQRAPRLRATRLGGSPEPKVADLILATGRWPASRARHTDLGR